MVLKNHRIDEIECLRAVAILFTLFHHTPFYLMIMPIQFFQDIYTSATFWGGVDLFFVISGFVIMRSFSHHLKSTQVTFWRSAGAFWIRRIWRILPSAWLWAAIYLMCTAYLNYTGAFGQMTQNFNDMKAAVFQYANIHGLSCRAVPCGPNGIYWSLSLEEQFYILLPFVLFLFRKVLIPFLLLAIALQFFIWRPDWSLGWAIRTDAMLWGVLLALWSENKTYQNWKPKILNRFPFLKIIFFLLCLVGIAVLPASPNQIQMGTGLLGFICALLVYVASLDQGYILNDNWLRKILVYIGSRSYSIYLVHIVAFRFSYEIIYQITGVGFRFSQSDNWRLAVIAYFLILIFSELNYRFVEQPFRKWGLRLASHFAPEKN